MSLECIIGLEIHIQLKTRSKMFCSCANIFPATGGGENVPPNSAICPICLGYPGTLPVPNKQAIEWTHKLGAALSCKLAERSKFDRKSYFYPDLPKGYQISQFDQPFCGSGKLTISVDGQPRTIGITRIHLEEDAAKNVHPKGAGYTLVDYNRAGTPLVEMVTEPDIRSPGEAKVFLQELQKIIRSLGISDADMEKGQMRCDANISLREEGNTALNPKTEIKNVNSFRFVERGLIYEIKRQAKLYEMGEIPGSATRGYDSNTDKTYEQRTKEEAADYRYFPEPDIPPFLFAKEYLEGARQDIGELPIAKQDRFKSQYGMNDHVAGLLASEHELGHLFEDTVSEIEQLDKERVEVAPAVVPELVHSAAKIITREIRDIIVKDGLTHKNLKITAENLAELTALVHMEKISRGAVRQVLNEMQRTGGDPDAIIQNLGLEQARGEDELMQYVDQVIEENPDIVEKIQSGKDSAVQFLMGQVMAKSQGRANPKVIIALLRDKLTK